MDTGLVTWRDPSGATATDRRPYGRTDPTVADRAAAAPRGTHLFEVWSVLDPDPADPRYGTCRATFLTLAEARADQRARPEPTALILLLPDDPPWLVRLAAWARTWLRPLWHWLTRPAP